jgi:hypothetical protein
VDGVGRPELGDRSFPEKTEHWGDDPPEIIKGEEGGVSGDDGRDEIDDGTGCLGRCSGFDGSKGCVLRSVLI